MTEKKKKNSIKPSGKKVSLNKKIKQAFEFLQQDNFEARSEQLKKCGEYGYAILIHWNQLETMIKLLYCIQQKKNKYPESFMTNWKCVQNIKSQYNVEAGRLFPTGKYTLRTIRNNVVHRNITINEEEYNMYYSSLQTIIKHIETELPSTVDNLKTIITSKTENIKKTVNIGGK